MYKRTRIVRGGLAIYRERSPSHRKDIVVYEYWGLPTGAAAMHKLGQINYQRGSSVYPALRGMKTGTELKDFPSQRAAEDWIAACDTWGSLMSLQEEASTNSAAAP